MFGQIFNKDITNLVEKNKNLQSLVDALKAANEERGEVINTLMADIVALEKRLENRN